MKYLYMQQNRLFNRFIIISIVIHNSLGVLMTMLEYFKVILQKVSFDINLFRTELIKATRSLADIEMEELKQWCVQTFGLQYCNEALSGYFS